MFELISILLLIIGAVFLFLAALGLVRMPDLFLRISSATKGATLGVGATMLAAALYFNNLAISVQALATFAFVLLTAPVAAHMIGRAAYFDGVPLWDQTRIDELCDQYDASTHALDSRPCAPAESSEPS
jgi:multicomponent Na+:H+ antiporter subunit G